MASARKTDTHHMCLSVASRLLSLGSCTLPFLVDLVLALQPADDDGDMVLQSTAVYRHEESGRLCTVYTLCGVEKL